MNGLPYYKRYPRDLIEGTLGMPFEIKVTYAFILDLIYMQGGKLPDDARYIAGVLGVSVRKWKSLRAAILKTGKLTAEGDYLTNKRAVSELESLAKYSRKQAENASGPRKNKGLEKPAQNHTDTDTDTDTLSYESDAEASDPAKIVFDSGLALLTEAGVKERPARALIGKWRKAAPDKRLAEIIEQAEGVADPAAYVTAALQSRPSREDERNNDLMEAWL